MNRSTHLDLFIKDSVQVTLLPIWKIDKFSIKNMCLNNYYPTFEFMLHGKYFLND